MKSYEKSIESIKKIVDSYNRLEKEIRNSQLNWNFKKLKEYAEALFQLAPFKVNDKVKLSKTPEITKEKGWGWLGRKHFLKKGAKAIVKNIDYSDGYFYFDLQFDDETYISGKKKIKVKEKGLYHFREDFIKKPAKEKSDKIKQLEDRIKKLEKD